MLFKIIGLAESADIELNDKLICFPECVSWGGNVNWDNRKDLGLEKLQYSFPLFLNFGRIGDGVYKGCILSLIVCSALTHDCDAKFCSNLIYKFVDYTIVVGLISNNIETEY